ncbi:hypothetical protein MMC25_004937 [Agyrium rufum]|nr:hypothetical protein [Agyrium rufum]
MIYLPSLRRILPPFVLMLIILAIYRSRIRSSIPAFVLHQPAPPQEGTRIDTSDFGTLAKGSRNDTSGIRNLIEREQYLLHPSSGTNVEKDPLSSSSPNSSQSLDPIFDVLFRCSRKPNKFTNHVRLPNIIRNISFVPPTISKPEARSFWNPTILPLPYWSPSRYLLVARVLTNGIYQQNVICEANTCYNSNVTDPKSSPSGDLPCTDHDLKVLGPAGGLRCVTEPMYLMVPSTPSKLCEGKSAIYIDIPGFHDPRIFWSGRGEPLMMVNAHSRYACFGLWSIDLRSLHTNLSSLLGNSPLFPSLGPISSYPHLTELTRNPPETRSAIEKNWFFFYPSTGESFLHHDIYDPLRPDSGRTFSKVVGGGFTTPNLTSLHESPCLPAGDTQRGRGEEGRNSAKREFFPKNGHWHQATPSLRMSLCSRADPFCVPSPENSVFFAIVHKKHFNLLGLPERYERYVMVWSAQAPYGMIGISKFPTLLANETAGGWWAWQNWWDEDGNRNVTERERRKAGMGGFDILGEEDGKEERGGKKEGMRKRQGGNETLSTQPNKETGSAATNLTVLAEERDRMEMMGNPWGGKDMWAGFTYTVSLSWAWRGQEWRGRYTSPLGESESKGERVKGGPELVDMGWGYWDDDVLLGIGIDDEGMGVARVRAGDLVGCLRGCGWIDDERPW